MWFAVLAPCLIFAAWSAWRDFWLRCYFLANLAQSAACWVALRFISWRSPAYGWVFSVGDFFLFLTYLPLVWLAIYRVSSRKFLLGVTAFLAVLCFRVALRDHPMGFIEWIEYVNASLDLIFGTCALIGSAYLKRHGDDMWRLAVSLGLLWMAQSYYEWGLGINLIHSEAWARLNEWMPTAILSVGCMIIARLSWIPVHRH